MGFVRGIQYEISAVNSKPVNMMDRLWEAHDLIIKAMTTHDGPFNWEGSTITTAKSTSGRVPFSSRIRRSGRVPAVHPASTGSPKRMRR